MNYKIKKIEPKDKNRTLNKFKNESNILKSTTQKHLGSTGSLIVPINEQLIDGQFQYIDGQLITMSQLDGKQMTFYKEKKNSS